jgi:hypothetical protein
MENITTITNRDGIEHIIIDHGNETFTSMTKAEYDRQQAEQSTPIVKDEPAAKK